MASDDSWSITILTRLMRKILIAGLLAGLTGCFRPAIPISTQPNYPVDVFYENQRPDRSFEELQKLEMTQETLVTSRQMESGRMISRGNNMQDKELLLAKMSMEAKKLGATALVNIKYTYYTTATVNGYTLTATAVRYRQEN